MPRYSKKFIDDSIKKFEQSEKNNAEFAKEIGVSEQTFSRWLSQEVIKENNKKVAKEENLETSTEKISAVENSKPSQEKKKTGSHVKKDENKELPIQEKESKTEAVPKVSKKKPVNNKQKNNPRNQKRKTSSQKTQKKPVSENGRKEKQKKEDNFNKALHNKDNSSVLPAFDYQKQTRVDVEKANTNYRRKLIAGAVIIVILIIIGAAFATANYIYQNSYDQAKDSARQEETITGKIASYQEEFSSLQEKDNELYNNKNATVSFYVTAYKNLVNFENKLLIDTSLINTVSGQRPNGYQALLNDIYSEKETMQNKILDKVSEEEKNIIYPEEMFNGDELKTDVTFDKSETYKSKYNECYTTISYIGEVQSLSHFINEDKMNELLSSLETKADKFNKLYLGALTKETYDAVNDKNRQEYEDKYNSDKKKLEDETNQKISTYTDQINQLNKDKENLEKQLKEAQKKSSTTEKSS